MFLLVFKRFSVFMGGLKTVFWPKRPALTPYGAEILILRVEFSMRVDLARSQASVLEVGTTLVKNRSLKCVFSADFKRFTPGA